jgi:predicted nucleic acid-binding Zn ribbon protein
MSNGLKQYNEFSLSQAMSKMIDDNGMRRKYNELEIRDAWDQVCGTMIANHTKSVRLQRKKIWVKIESAPLRQELSYRKEDLVQKMNEQLGHSLIEDIVIE